MNTLLLNQDGWDLCVDISNNIAMASAPYALAQDAASAIKLFLGELWYDTTKGIPYWESILGQRPTLSFLKTQLVNAALTVPGVTAAKVFLSDVTDRTLHGQVFITDATGETALASF